MRELFDDLTNKRYENSKKLLTFTNMDFLTSVFECSTDIHHCLEVQVQSNRLQRLLQAIKKIFGYYDYQVTNPYKFHKKIPSARNVHPEVIYVMFDGRVYRYDVLLDAFIYCQDTSTSSGFRILIGLDIGRISKIYGTFGLALSFLDMGHMIAAFETAVMDEQMNVDIMYMFDRVQLKKDLCIPEDVFLGSIIGISNEYVESKTVHEPKRLRMAVDRKVVDYSKDLELLGITDYLNSLKRQAPFKRKGQMPMTSCLLEDEWNQRTSANSSMGLIDLGIDLSQTKWQQLVDLSQNMIHKYANRGSLTIYLVVRQQSTALNGYYRISHDDITFQATEIQIEQLLHDDINFFNMEDASFACFVTYEDRHHTIEEQIYYAHVFSGEIVQQLSNFFIKEKCYVRPLKNFNDVYLQHHFDLRQEERIMYMLLSGKTVTKNLKYLL
jgi:hypothetical protein